MSSTIEKNFVSKELTEQATPHVCPWWVAYFFDNPLRRVIHPAKKVLSPFVKPGMKVMDFGCGFGHFSLGMAQLVTSEGQVFAVDIQEKMLAKVRKRSRKARLDDVIRIIRCESTSIQLPEQLDFILACNSLHETPDPALTLRTFCNLLKPGGRFLLLEPPGHLKKSGFEREVALSVKNGFTEIGRPDIRREMSCLFQKD